MFCQSNVQNSVITHVTLLYGFNVTDYFTRLSTPRKTFTIYVMCSNACSMSFIVNPLGLDPPRLEICGYTCCVVLISIIEGRSQEQFINLRIKQLQAATNTIGCTATDSNY